MYSQIPQVIPYGEIFYGKENIEELIPSYENLPNEFKEGTTKWRRSATIWFKKGLHKDSKLVPKSDINKEIAITNIQCIMSSFFINMTYKISAAAYLLNMWFDDVYMVY